jgi:hypothetical protein
MVVGECRRLCTLWCSHVVLLLLWTAARSHGGIANALTSLVSGMIEQRSDIVNEKRIEHLGDLLLVGEIQRAIEWNPEGVSIEEDLLE